MNAMAGAATSSGDIDWNDYAQRQGIKLLPLGRDTSKDHFVRTILEAIAEFIDAAPTSGHARRIFDLRIVPQQKSRKTLEQTAEILGSTGPQIKREEGVLLSRLQDAIFEGNYLAATARFQPSFVESWEEARAIRSSNPDLNDFWEVISAQWKVSKGDLLRIVPTLVAVIDGKPRGYPGMESSFGEDGVSIDFPPIEELEAAIEPVVRLRGFRNVH